MPLERRGVALAAFGVVVLSLAFALAPPPAWLDDVVQRERDVPERLLARGPATAARYDADAGVTHAVFECSHWSCPHAVTIQGDAREEVAGAGVLLVADAPRPFGTAPLDPPLETRWNETVATRLDGTFLLAPRWPGASGIATGVSMVLAGVAFALRLPGAAVGALASVALVTSTLVVGGGWIILAQVIVVPASIVAALVAFSLSRRRPRWRQLGAAFAAYLPTLVLLMALRFLAYFPLDGP